ncbi:hypothetical protein [Streptomyces sp. NPDC005017]|uniref:hypothetical protein n=1 Tax=Streptomyces sp. NPDC005017 TaxID=3364706 RepID=UPI0036C4DBBD
MTGLRTQLAEERAARAFAENEARNLRERLAGRTKHIAWCPGAVRHTRAAARSGPDALTGRISACG